MYEWFIGSLILLIVWFILFLFNKNLKKEMLKISLFTMPLGLTEPLFVPEYWSPPSLFNLALTTGFDIESLIFCFAIGGIVFILYNLLFKVEEIKLPKKEKHKPRHRFHIIALSSAPIIFIILYLSTNLNPIYSTSIAMFLGGIAAIYCRPDLKYKIWYGGLIFLLIYFILLLMLTYFSPNYIQEVWNLEALTGIFILSIPLEELMFAFTFGMLWSSLYEHYYWYTLK